MNSVFGRTNVPVPRIWLSLSLPRPGGDPPDLQALADAARETGAILDISSSPAAWGGQMRGTDATVMTIGPNDLERAPDEETALNLVQAHLIETLSGLGREHLDFYFLRVRTALEEYQINGALEALETARQEGLVRFLGLCAEGSSLAALGAWQFHDAYEALLVPRNHRSQTDYDGLAPLAKERRVGLATSRPLNWGYGVPFPEAGPWRLRNLTQSFYGLTVAQAAIADLAADHPVLVGVRSPKEVEQAVACAGAGVPEGLQTMLAEFRAAWEDDATWDALAREGAPWLRDAAARRLRDASRA